MNALTKQAEASVSRSSSSIKVCVVLELLDSVEWWFGKLVYS
jgi:hypothetical protein